jgi:hypothetical protein
LLAGGRTSLLPPPLAVLLACGGCGEGVERELRLEWLLVVLVVLLLTAAPPKRKPVSLVSDSSKLSPDPAACSSADASVGE